MLTNCNDQEGRVPNPPGRNQQGSCVLFNVSNSVLHDFFFFLILRSKPVYVVRTNTTFSHFDKSSSRNLRDALATRTPDAIAFPTNQYR